MMKLIQTGYQQEIWAITLIRPVNRDMNVHKAGKGADKI